LSTSVYPTLAGSQIDVDRTPVYSTTVQTEASGRELRIAQRSAARYRYRISYDFLRQNASPDEAQTLLAFLSVHRGQWDSFLFTDPYNAAASATSFGTGDGTTTIFYLRDEIGDRVGACNGTPQIYKDGVLQTVTTHYTLDSTNGKVTFVTAPANGLPLTWTGAFYRRVRFARDDIPMTRRVSRIWRAEVELISVL
jgi:uncharacterized protein (TIGR02217 family)